jgi:hypothetical protein
VSTKETVIRKSFNMPVGDLVSIVGGVYWGVSLRSVVGVKPIRRNASTGATKGTVHSSPIAQHKWAARVGMYNDDPIWGEIFQNVRDNRQRLRKESKSSE